MYEYQLLIEGTPSFCLCILIKQLIISVINSQFKEMNFETES